MQVWNDSHSPWGTCLERDMESGLLQFGSSENERGKFVYLMADSMIRQWLEYFKNSINSMPQSKLLYTSLSEILIFVPRKQSDMPSSYFLTTTHRNFSRHNCLSFKRICSSNWNGGCAEKVYSIPIPMPASECSQHAQKVIDRAENNVRFYIFHFLQLA